MNYLEPFKPENNVVGFKTLLRGRYKMEAVKADGSRRLLADWFDNLILDNGLNILGTAASQYNGFVSVGTGNTAPATTQSALVTWLASTSTVTTSSNSNSGASPYYGLTTMTFRFAIGTATGNLSEVGIGSANNGTNLFSRALILDGSGNPTTITVLSTEALDVTYQLQMYAPTVDVTGTVTINAVVYSYTMRAANVTGSFWNGLSSATDHGGVSTVSVYNGTIGAVTAGPSGSSAGFDSAAVQTYTNGNFYVDSIVSWGLTSGNLTGGITAILITMGVNRSTMGQFQLGITPALPKDGSHTMTLTFRNSWGRYP